MIKKAGLLPYLFCASALPVNALDLTPDGVNAGFGKSFSLNNTKPDLNAYRGSIVWDWGEPLVSFSGLQISGYFDVALNHWKSNLGPSDVRSVGASQVKSVSFSPVFRLQSSAPHALGFFLDAGVGLSYQSEKDIQQEKTHSAVNMGGHTQFEIRLMAGLHFGQRQQYEIAYGWYHYSNANLHDVNEGLDFQTISLGYRF
ncbi:acyloxyacyl hydrolase [Candidatus Sororendozoicomonas aggregata]|uniref:acyloxyacyl hydrolase n=1 Tax=Candidatus Sororendozoicomonas aggregata TaxID=3073239 RepID=UPI002ED61CE2